MATVSSSGSAGESSSSGGGGGIPTGWQKATAEITALAIRFKAEAEQKLGTTFSIYVPLSFRTQVVAGTKFFIIVEISKTEYFQGTIELEIFENLKKDFIFINATPLYSGEASANVNAANVSPASTGGGGWLSGWDPRWGIGPAKPPSDGSGGWLPGWNPQWGVGPAKPPSSDDDDDGSSGGWLPGWNPQWGVGPAKPPHWGHGHHWGPGPVIPPWLHGWKPWWGVGPAKPPHWGHGHPWGPGPVVPPWAYWNPLWGVGPVIPPGSGVSTPLGSAAAPQTDIALPPGGWWQPITPKVAKLAESVKAQAEAKLGGKVDKYIPVEFQAEGSHSSTLYRIAVETHDLTLYVLGAPQVHKFYSEVTLVEDSNGEVRFVDAVALLNGLPPLGPRHRGPPIPTPSKA